MSENKIVIIKEKDIKDFLESSILEIKKEIVGEVINWNDKKLNIIEKFLWDLRILLYYILKDEEIFNNYEKLDDEFKNIFKNYFQEYRSILYSSIEFQKEESLNLNFKFYTVLLWLNSLIKKYEENICVPE